MSKLRVAILLSASLLPAIGLAGMAMGEGGMMDGCMMNMSMARHHFVMRNGIGEEYAGKSNPLSGDDGEIRQGQVLYEQHCASCHGESGRGDGPAGKHLSPRPANIARFSKMPMASDAYLLWTISEGGVALGSAMPPMKGVLSEQERWKIIAYLRSL